MAFSNNNVCVRYGNGLAFFPIYSIKHTTKVNDIDKSANAVAVDTLYTQ